MSVPGKTRQLALANQAVAGKLGLHHFAYLRACAEGLDPRKSAILYLGCDPHDGRVVLRQSHRRVMEQIQALARRSGDSRWRLVGLRLKPGQNTAQKASGAFSHEHSIEGERARFGARNRLLTSE